MQKFHDTVTATGEGGILTPLANASVAVFLTGTQTPASLYSDNGVTAKANPFLSSATGLVSFYAPDNRYDIVVSKAGFNTVTLADIILEDIDDSVTTDISNAQIVSSAFSGGTMNGTTVSGGTHNDVSSNRAQLYDSEVSNSVVVDSQIFSTSHDGGAVSNVAVTASTINSSRIGDTAPTTGRFTSVALTTGASGGIGFGEMRLNPTELTLDVGLSNGVVGQMFEEHFISFTNTSGAAMTSGQVVGFAGVDNTNSIPYGRLVTAEAIYNPLYTMGVVTQDIAAGAYGRATMFGKVRNVNTTGFPVGEVWAPGDLLYIHPTVLGALTNVEPTVPAQSLLVAAVLRVGATTGTMLVRPQLSPHLHYATYASHVTQTLSSAETPTAVTFDTTDIASGPTITDGTKIYPQQAGLIDLGFSAQLAKASANTNYVWFWARINGVDVADSAKKISIAGSGTNTVASWDFMVPMTELDYFELMWTADNDSVTLAAVAQETFCPSIPSVQLSVKQASH